MYKSKIKLLWYKPGDIINQEDEQYCADWLKKNFVEEVGKPIEQSNIDKRLKEITDDLKDDGKLNHSNNPNKKSPGRKKKSSKGKK